MNEQLRNGGASATDPFLQAALGSMPYGFSIWDDRLKLALFNRHYLEMYRFPEGAVRIGMSLMDICELTVSLGNHPGFDAQSLYATYQTRFADTQEPGSSRIYEKPIRGRDVKVTHIRVEGLGWTIIHEDVTEAKAAADTARRREASLTLQNMRFDAAVNNMSQGLCMFDANRQLVVCNEPYARMYGLPPELTEPGTDLRTILEHVYASGMVPRIGREAYVARLCDMVVCPTESRGVVEMLDGRAIAVEHHPMADGGGVATHEDITERRTAEQRIHHLARHDMLTDLPNRMLFGEAMKNAEQRIGANEAVAVMCVDLDHFKEVNDNGGHALGDAVLVEAAQRLRHSTRKTDLVARLGGDEFAIIASPLPSPGDAEELAGRVVKTLSRPFRVEGHQLRVGGSVGVALAPRDGADAETLLRNADLALYHAKGEGRGRFHFFEKGMHAGPRHQLPRPTVT